ncbi:MAG: ribonuclease HII [Parasporobacterium sp.]|nr:ribonuclease HII [Parasporobacterium sp.]
MTKKEEAEAKRAAKLEAERSRIEQMKVYERGHGEFRLVCGIDEAGRGPFAGPVVAGAVILDINDPEKEILYLNDSKKLSEKKREVLYREILSKALAVGVGYAGSVTIDRINILQATYQAMRNAISNLTCVSHLVTDDDDVHDLVRKLVRYELHRTDGNPDTVKEYETVRPEFILADAVRIPGIDIPQEGIIKGDAKSVSIAAGSIIAKVTRDHIMYEYDRMYPQYGFASNKGYGTASHIAAIKEYGMTDIHRRSFIHL